jgi:SAM-dependent methyltransferase
MAWISLRRGVQRMLSSLTIQPIYRIGETLRMLPEGAKICDIGAGGRKITPNTYTIDAHVSENTSLACDIHSIPLPDELFDCIFCTGTLEHVREPDRALKEIHRLLRKKGYHADPVDYWRWTLQGLKLSCSKTGFSEVSSATHIGPASALNWILNENILCLFGNGKFGNAVGAFFRLHPGEVPGRLFAHQRDFFTSRLRHLFRRQEIGGSWAS